MQSLVSYVQDRPGHDRRYALNCKKIETEARLEPGHLSGGWPPPDH